MDYIVGKATELGVSRIIALEAAHSVRRASLSGHAARWRRLAAEAAEQCGRCRVPELAGPCALEDFLRRHPRDQPLLVCDAGDGATPLAGLCRTLRSASTVTVLVGGEGGLSAGEIDAVRSAAGRFAVLGPRLLRADTAALAALAVLQACIGDWAGPNSVETGSGVP
jgi:16S rRNA (uracil1498-N3)-methyltransferase